MLTVVVVIPCRNEAATIEALLAAIAGQTRLPDEVVVVDDGSTDETVKRVEGWTSQHPQVVLRVVASHGRGAAAAMNAGIMACHADVVVRLDGHSVPDADYIEWSLKALSAEGAGVVGGVWHVVPGADTPMGQAIASVVSHPLGAGGAAYRNEIGSRAVETVETVPFGAFRRSLWEQLSGYDESLAANQDFDFNYRTRKAGFEVVLDRRIRSTYRARPALRALARQYQRYGFWKVQMLRKDPRALHWRQVPPALVLPWLLASLSLALVSGHPAAWLAAAMYPAVVVIGASQVTLRDKTSSTPRFLAATCAAFATVHIAWSVGFWKGIVRSAQDSELRGLCPEDVVRDGRVSG